MAKNLFFYVIAVERDMHKDKIESWLIHEELKQAIFYTSFQESQRGVIGRHHKRRILDREISFIGR